MKKIHLETNRAQNESRIKIAWVVESTQQIKSETIERILHADEREIERIEPPITKDVLVTRKCCFPNGYPSDWRKLKQPLEPSLIILDTDDVNYCCSFLNAHRKSARYYSIPVIVRTSDPVAWAKGHVVHNADKIIGRCASYAEVRKCLKALFKKLPEERAWFSSISNKFFTPRDLLKAIQVKKLTCILQIEDIATGEAFRYYVISGKDVCNRDKSVVSSIEKRTAGEYEFISLGNDLYANLEEITRPFVWRHNKCIVSQTMWVPEIFSPIDVDDLISFLPADESYGYVRVIKTPLHSVQETPKPVETPPVLIKTIPKLMKKEQPSVPPLQTIVL